MKKRIFLTSLFMIGLGILFMTGCQTKEVTSAKVYIQQDNWDKAIEQLELAVAQYPTDAEAWYLLGEGYATRGEWQQMNNAFNKSLKIIPTWEPQIKSTRDKYWVTNLNSGVNRINSGDTPGAIRQFKTCTQIEPGRVEAYRNLAVSYLKADSLELAADTYLEVVIYLARASKNTSLEKVSLLALGDKQSKLVDISAYKLVPDKQKTIDLIHEAARALSQIKDYSNVIALENEALQMDPTQTDAIINMAMAYDLMGDQQKAMDEYQKALDKTPNDKDLIFNLGRLYYQNENYDQAIELFKKTIAMNPEDYDANLIVGNAFLSMGDELRKKLVEKDHNGQAVTKEERDKLTSFYADAVPYLEKAVSLKGDDANVWNNLGIAYVNSGNTAKGKECFDKSESLKK
jgi:tetratricopeptide (TPR) repeat protein